MRIAVPDLISPSYFPALAAVELGFFQREGLDMTHDLRAPADRTYADLRDGQGEFVAAEAHAALAAFPNWRGVKLLCALSQGMYWFLVMRADLGAARGDLSVVRGRRIGAAPWVEMGLRRMLLQAGIDPIRDAVDIAPIPGTLGLKVNIGVTAAEALADGRIDGFWANGMGAEIAVRRGVGSVVIDARRGDGPPPCPLYRGNSRNHRSADCRAPGGRGRRDSRDRGDTVRPASRSVASNARGSQTVSPGRGRTHRGTDRTRPAVLRSAPSARLHLGNEQIRARSGDS
jgi:hypothetical protein